LAQLDFALGHKESSKPPSGGFFIDKLTGKTFANNEQFKQNR
jgi:hypothetical protein